MSAVRQFAMFAGVQFIIFGILGFIPGITQPPPSGAPDLAVDSGYGYLLGLLPVNILHNLFHLVSGIVGVAASRSFSGAKQFSRGLAIVYGLLTIMGLIPGMNTTFGLIPIYGADVAYHAILAVAAAYFGWMAPVDARHPDHAARV